MMDLDELKHNLKSDKPSIRKKGRQLCDTLLFTVGKVSIRDSSLPPMQSLALLDAAITYVQREVENAIRGGKRSNMNNESAEFMRKMIKWLTKFGRLPPHRLDLLLDHLVDILTKEEIGHHFKQIYRRIWMDIVSPKWMHSISIQGEEEGGGLGLMQGFRYLKQVFAQDSRLVYDGYHQRMLKGLCSCLINDADVYEAFILPLISWMNQLLQTHDQDDTTNGLSSTIAECYTIILHLLGISLSNKLRAELTVILNIIARKLFSNKVKETSVESYCRLIYSIHSSLSLEDKIMANAMHSVVEFYEPLQRLCIQFFSRSVLSSIGNKRQSKGRGTLLETQEAAKDARLYLAIGAGARCYLMYFHAVKLRLSSSRCWFVLTKEEEWERHPSKRTIVTVSENESNILGSFIKQVCKDIRDSRNKEDEGVAVALLLLENIWAIADETFVTPVETTDLFVILVDEVLSRLSHSSPQSSFMVACSCRLLHRLLSSSNFALNPDSVASKSTEKLLMVIVTQEESWRILSEDFHLKNVVGEMLALFTLLMNHAALSHLQRKAADILLGCKMFACDGLYARQFSSFIVPVLYQLTSLHDFSPDVLLRQLVTNLQMNATIVSKEASIVKTIARCLYYISFDLSVDEEASMIQWHHHETMDNYQYFCWRIECISCLIFRLHPPDIFLLGLDVYHPVSVVQEIWLQEYNLNEWCCLTPTHDSIVPPFIPVVPKFTSVRAFHDCMSALVLLLEAVYQSLAQPDGDKCRLFGALSSLFLGLKLLVAGKTYPSLNMTVLVINMTRIILLTLQRIHDWYQKNDHMVMRLYLVLIRDIVKDPSWNMNTNECDEILRRGALDACSNILKSLWQELTLDNATIDQPTDSLSLDADFGSSSFPSKDNLRTPSQGTVSMKSKRDTSMALMVVSDLISWLDSDQVNAGLNVFNSIAGSLSHSPSVSLDLLAALSFAIATTTQTKLCLTICTNMLGTAKDKRGYLCSLKSFHVLLSSQDFAMTYAYNIDDVDTAIEFIISLLNPDDEQAAQLHSYAEKCWIIRYWQIKCVVAILQTFNSIPAIKKVVGVLFHNALNDCNVRVRLFAANHLHLLLKHFQKPEKIYETVINLQGVPLFCSQVDASKFSIALQGDEVNEEATDILVHAVSVVAMVQMAQSFSNQLSMMSRMLCDLIIVCSSRQLHYPNFSIPQLTALANILTMAVDKISKVWDYVKGGDLVYDFLSSVYLSWSIRMIDFYSAAAIPHLVANFPSYLLLSKPYNANSESSLQLLKTLSGPLLQAISTFQEGRHRWNLLLQLCSSAGYGSSDASIAAIVKQWLYKMKAVIDAAVIMRFSDPGLTEAVTSLKQFLSRILPEQEMLQITRSQISGYVEELFLVMAFQHKYPIHMHRDAIIDKDELNIRIHQRLGEHLSRLASSLKYIDVLNLLQSCSWLQIFTRLCKQITLSSTYDGCDMVVMILKFVTNRFNDIQLYSKVLVNALISLVHALVRRSQHPRAHEASFTMEFIEHLITIYSKSAHPLTANKVEILLDVAAIALFTSFSLRFQSFGQALIRISSITSTLSNSNQQCTIEEALQSLGSLQPLMEAYFETIFQSAAACFVYLPQVVNLHAMVAAFFEYKLTSCMPLQRLLELSCAVLVRIMNGESNVQVTAWILLRHVASVLRQLSLQRASSPICDQSTLSSFVMKLVYYQGFLCRSSHRSEEQGLNEPLLAIIADVMSLLASASDAINMNVSATSLPLDTVDVVGCNCFDEKSLVLAYLRSLVRCIVQMDSIVVTGSYLSSISRLQSSQVAGLLMKHLTEGSLAFEISPFERDLLLEFTIPHLTTGTDSPMSVLTDLFESLQGVNVQNLEEYAWDDVLWSTIDSNGIWINYDVRIQRLAICLARFALKCNSAAAKQKSSKQPVAVNRLIVRQMLESVPIPLSTHIAEIIFLLAVLEISVYNEGNLLNIEVMSRRLSSFTSTQSAISPMTSKVDRMKQLVIHALVLLWRRRLTDNKMNHVEGAHNYTAISAMPTKSSPFSFSSLVPLSVNLLNIAQSCIKCDLLCTSLLFIELWSEEVRYSDHFQHNPDYERIFEVESMRDKWEQIQGMINVIAHSMEDVDAADGLDVGSNPLLQARSHINHNRWIDALPAFESLMSNHFEDTEVASKGVIQSLRALGGHLSAKAFATYQQSLVQSIGDQAMKGLRSWEVDNDPIHSLIMNNQPANQDPLTIISKEEQLHHLFFSEFTKHSSHRVLGFRDRIIQQIDLRNTLNLKILVQSYKAPSTFPLHNDTNPSAIDCLLGAVYQNGVRGSNTMYLTQKMELLTSLWKSGFIASDAAVQGVEYIVHHAASSDADARIQALNVPLHHFFHELSSSPVCGLSSSDAHQSLMRSYCELLRSLQLWQTGFHDAALQLVSHQVIGPLKETAVTSTGLLTASSTSLMNKTKKDSLPSHDQQPVCQLSKKVLANGLLLKGIWLSRKSSSTAELVLKDLLSPALQASQSLQQRAEAWSTMAQLSLHAVQAAKSKIQSNEWKFGQRILKDRVAEFERCRELQIQAKASQVDGAEAANNFDLRAIGRHSMMLKKEIEMDVAERQAVVETFRSSLVLTIQRYGQVLEVSKEADQDVIFRMINLWFGHAHLVSEINDVMQEIVNKVPSYKFVPLHYQIMSRLGSVHWKGVNEISSSDLNTRIDGMGEAVNNTFTFEMNNMQKKRSKATPSSNETSQQVANQVQQVIYHLSAKMIREHPHCVLPQLFALVNDQNIDEASGAHYYKSNTSTERCQVANKLLHDLLTQSSVPPRVTSLVQSCQRLVDSYIKLARITPEMIQSRLKSSKKSSVPSRINFSDIYPKNEIPFHECLQGLHTLPPVLTKAIDPHPIPFASDFNLKFSKDFSLAGGYENDVVHAIKFAPTFQLTESGISRPKIITCLGDDGCQYKQLVKGGDDMRQDAVMEQVFESVNQTLHRDIQTSRRSLHIRTYKIIPLTPQTGVLEFVEGTIAFGKLLIDPLHGLHSRYHPLDWSHAQCRDYLRDATTLLDKEARFRQLYQHFHPAFRFFFLEQFVYPKDWYARRLAYTHSVATNSMIGYVLGIGDRHAHNILIDLHSAEVVHIDFGIVFDQGKGLGTPETVPFRLTRDIIDGMGILGHEGNFRRSCEEVLRVLRSQMITLVTILEVIIHDPLYKWNLSPFQARMKQQQKEGIPTPPPTTAPGALLSSSSTMLTESKRKRPRSRNDSSALSNQQVESEETHQPPYPADLADDRPTSSTFSSDAATRALAKIRNKLLGGDNPAAEYLTISDQVDLLIQEAKDPRNLSKLFPGWAPWL